MNGIIDYINDINNIDFNSPLSIDVYTKDSYYSSGLYKFRCLDIHGVFDYRISLYPHHDSVALITVIEDGKVIEFDINDINFLRQLFIRVEDKIGKSLFDDYWLKFDDPITYTRMNMDLGIME